MSKFQTNGVLTFALGVVSSVAVMLALGADRSSGASGPASPRYQISSWATNDQHGAYRVDSETGSVLEIKDNHCTDVN